MKLIKTNYSLPQKSIIIEFKKAFIDSIEIHNNICWKSTKNITMRDLYLGLVEVRDILQNMKIMYCKIDDSIFEIMDNYGKRFLITTIESVFENTKINIYVSEELVCLLKI